MRPSDAAVMPLPSEEVTPPVTNTNFGNATTSGVFSMLTGRQVVTHCLDSGADSEAGRGAAVRKPMSQARSPPRWALRYGNHRDGRRIAALGSVRHAGSRSR